MWSCEASCFHEMNLSHGDIQAPVGPRFLPGACWAPTTLCVCFWPSSSKLGLANSFPWFCSFCWCESAKKRHHAGTSFVAVINLFDLLGNSRTWLHGVSAKSWRWDWRSTGSNACTISGKPVECKWDGRRFWNNSCFSPTPSREQQANMRQNRFRSDVCSELGHQLTWISDNRPHKLNGTQMENT